MHNFIKAKNGKASERRGPNELKNSDCSENRGVVIAGEVELVKKPKDNSSFKWSFYEHAQYVNFLEMNRLRIKTKLIRKKCKVLSRPKQAFNVEAITKNSKNAIDSLIESSLDRRSAYLLRYMGKPQNKEKHSSAKHSPAANVNELNTSSSKNPLQKWSPSLAKQIFWMFRSKPGQRIRQTMRKAVQLIGRSPNQQHEISLLLQ